MKFKMLVAVAAILAAFDRAAARIEERLFAATKDAQNTAYSAGVAEVQADLNRKQAALQDARRALEYANTAAVAALRSQTERLDAVAAKVFG